MLHESMPISFKFKNIHPYLEKNKNDLTFCLDMLFLISVKFQSCSDVTFDHGVHVFLMLRESSIWTSASLLNPELRRHKFATEFGGSFDILHGIS